jgi:hypothetical protein
MLPFPRVNVKKFLLEPISPIKIKVTKKAVHKMHSLLGTLIYENDKIWVSFNYISNIYASSVFTILLLYNHLELL